MKTKTTTETVVWIDGRDVVKAMSLLEERLTRLHECTPAEGCSYDYAAELVSDALHYLIESSHELRMFASNIREEPCKK